MHFLQILGNSSVYVDNYLSILGHSFVRGVSENFVSFSREGLAFREGLSLSRRGFRPPQESMLRMS